MTEQKIHITDEMHSRSQSIMLHAVGFVTGDPTIKISNPYVYHPGVQVTVTEPGDSKWIYMMLPINKGSLITDIKLAYHRVGIESNVSIIRLVEQKEPISATVIHDFRIDNNLTPSTGVISTTCNVLVNNSILLKVCLDFTSTDDMVEFGSVEIRYIPDYELLTNNHNLNSTLYSKSINWGNGQNPKSTKRSAISNLFSKRKKNIITNK